MIEIKTGISAGSLIQSSLSRLEMSELCLYLVQERGLLTSCNMNHMMSVLREIEDFVLDSPILLTSTCEKLVEKFRAALLARQKYHPQLVKVYQPQIVNCQSLSTASERRREPQVSFRLSQGVGQCTND